MRLDVNEHSEPCAGEETCREGKVSEQETAATAINVYAVAKTISGIGESTKALEGSAAKSARNQVRVPLPQRFIRRFAPRVARPTK